MSLSSGEISIFFSSIVSVLFFLLIILTIALQVKKRILEIRKQKNQFDKGAA
jgi:TctA family transporter